MSTAYACSESSACRGYRTAIDDDVAAIQNRVLSARIIIACADAGRVAVAACSKRTAALNGQRAAYGHVDSGVVLIETFERIFAN